MRMHKADNPGRPSHSLDCLSHFHEDQSGDVMCNQCRQCYDNALMVVWLHNSGEGVLFLLWQVGSLQLRCINISQDISRGC
jgi:hypothetical protein